MWEKQPEFDLVAVEAGLAVAALSPAQNAGPSTLTAFALEDGAPVWTMPEVARVGTLRLGTDPVRPPGWLRTTALLPVIRVGGYPSDTAAEPATWSLVSAATGEVTAELVQGGAAGMPVGVGEVALRSQCRPARTSRSSTGPRCGGRASRRSASAPWCGWWTRNGRC